MKVAVLSFAHNRAATYARLLNDTPDVDLITSDPDGPSGDPDRGRTMASRLDVSYVDRWEEVFAVHPDAVVVTSEIDRRRGLVERSAEIGAQVLCEHPLAPTETDVQAMVDACTDAGVRLTLASPTCFSPAFNAVRRGIAQDKLGGKPTTIHGAYHCPGWAPSMTREPAACPALAANATYLLDMVDAVLDGEPAEQVYAQTNNILGGEAGAESTALITVRFPSGVVAAIDCGVSPPGNQLAPAGPTMAFIGERASVEFNAHPRLLNGFDTATNQEWWRTGGTDLYSVMLSEFVTAVSGGNGVGPDGAAGLRTLRTIHAAYESAHTGEPVGVAPTEPPP